MKQAYLIAGLIGGAVLLVHHYRKNVAPSGQTIKANTQSLVVSSGFANIPLSQSVFIPTKPVQPTPDPNAQSTADQYTTAYRFLNGRSPRQAAGAFFAKILPEYKPSGFLYGG